MSAREGRHDSGDTSTREQSGNGGQHSRTRDLPAGWPLGKRLDEPHAKDGWWPPR